MLSLVYGNLNRSKQISISSAETGNSVILFDTIVDSESVLEITGVDWGTVVVDANDRTNFLFCYVVAILDYPFDPTSIVVSRIAPSSTEGEVMFWIGSHSPTLQYDDFSTPFLVPPSRRLSIYTVQPLLSLAQVGSVVMQLTVKGEFKPRNRNTETIGGLLLR